MCQIYNLLKYIIIFLNQCRFRNFEFRIFRFVSNNSTSISIEIIGMADQVDLRKALKAGARNYLAYPIDPAEVKHVSEVINETVIREVQITLVFESEPLIPSLPNFGISISDLNDHSNSSVLSLFRNIIPAIIPPFLRKLRIQSSDYHSGKIQINT